MIYALCAKGISYGDEADRVLEYADGPEARKCLEEFAKDSEDPRLRETASAALKRLAAASGK